VKTRKRNTDARNETARCNDHIMTNKMVQNVRTVMTVSRDSCEKKRTASQNTSCCHRRRRCYLLKANRQCFCTIQHGCFFVI